MTESAHPAKRDREALTLGASEESFRLIVETIPGLIAVMTPEPYGRGYPAWERFVQAGS